MSPRTWVFLVAVIVVAGALVLARAGEPQDSPEHRSDSDGPNGTSALFQYAQALGHPTKAMTDPLGSGRSTSLLFVFSPITDVTDTQLSDLKDWIARGGVLVYVDAEGYGQIDGAFKLRRALYAVAGQSTSAGPLLPGVTRVNGEQAVVPFDPNPDQVVLLRSGRGALAVMETRGAGRIVALCDPQELVNLHINEDDNWRLAADLIAMAPPGAAIAFDEFHHGLRTGEGPPYSLLVFTWAQGLALAGAVLFFGLALRGRAFGPRLPITPDTGRPAEEYVNAVGTLLKRAQARNLTLELLLTATRRQLRERAGIARGGPSGDQALESRQPELAGRLQALEATAAGAERSDGELLETARRLHELAMPGQGRSS
jgi:hypothetical protein